MIYGDPKQSMWFHLIHTVTQKIDVILLDAWNGWVNLYIEAASVKRITRKQKGILTYKSVVVDISWRTNLDHVADEFLARSKSKGRV